MNKMFSSLGAALAILMLLPGHAYSRGGNGGQGRGNFNRSTPAPVAPTPVPAPLPVQGIITTVTPFAVSIKAGPQTVMLTFKVGRESAITVDGKTVGLTELKPGMSATITPTPDRIYAGAIVASAPVAAAPVPPMPDTVAVPPSMQSVQGGNSSSPFGQRSMP